MAGCVTCGSTNVVLSGKCSKCESVDTNIPENAIKNGDENYCFNEIGNEECQNLYNNEGIHKYQGNFNDSVTDLKNLNQLGYGSVNNEICVTEVCDPNELKRLLNLMNKWLWNKIQAIACIFAGVFARLDYLQCQIDALKEALLLSLSGNYSTEGVYEILEDNGSIKVNVNPDGSYYYKWSDYDGSGVKIGSGTYTGKINFTSTVSPASGNLIVNLASVYIEKIVYVSTGEGGNLTSPTFNLKVPTASSPIVWSKSNPAPIVSFTENINQTVGLGGQVIVEPKQQKTIDFLNVFSDWVGDDEAQLKMVFKNNNNTLNIGECPEP